MSNNRPVGGRPDYVQEPDVHISHLFARVSIIALKQRYAMQPIERGRFESEAYSSLRTFETIFVFVDEVTTFNSFQFNTESYNTMQSDYMGDVFLHARSH